MTHFLPSDQIIVCGDTAVLIEAKLATCKAADRYSGDYEKIKAYLEEKLVTKGVGQLLNAVRRIGAKGADVPEYFKGIKKLIPLISCLERMMWVLKEKAFCYVAPFPPPFPAPFPTVILSPTCPYPVFNLPL